MTHSDRVWMVHSYIIHTLSSAAQKNRHLRPLSGVEAAKNGGPHGNPGAQAPAGQRLPKSNGVLGPQLGSPRKGAILGSFRGPLGEKPRNGGSLGYRHRLPDADLLRVVSAVPSLTSKERPPISSPM